MKLCEKCKTDPVDGGRKARQCKKCRLEGQVASGRKRGKITSASGKADIYIPSRREEE
jgi:hypothetical protein